MAKNFRIDVITRNANALYIRVMGDFDGESAYRLLEVVNSNGHHLRKITIDTNAVGKIHAFGAGILSINLKRLKNRGLDIVLVGRGKTELSAG